MTQMKLKQISYLFQTVEVRSPHVQFKLGHNHLSRGGLSALEFVKITYVRPSLIKSLFVVTRPTHENHRDSKMFLAQMANYF